MQNPAAAGGRADVEPRSEDRARGDGLIREIARELHVPVLCNIHDVELACEFCTHVIGPAGRRQEVRGPPGELDERAMQDIYAMEVL
jgi:phosphonate transport system ATP-binding protein